MVLYLDVAGYAWDTALARVIPHATVLARRVRGRCYSHSLLPVSRSCPCLVADALRCDSLLTAAAVSAPSGRLRCAAREGDAQLTHPAAGHRARPARLSSRATAARTRRALTWLGVLFSTQG